MKTSMERKTWLVLLALALVCAALPFAGCHRGGGGDDGGGGTAALDTTAPSILSCVPADGATAVALNTALTVAFSEALDPSTVNEGTFILKDGSGAAVSGAVTFDATNNVAVFTPSGNLANSTAYTATITTGVKDLAGNALAADYSWSFTTGDVLDTTAPAVVSTNPVNGATDVVVVANIAATFSEAMNPATITGSTIIVSAGGVNVTGAVTLSADGMTATFDPASDLNFSTTYTVTITTGVKDLSGNALAADYSWSFTTAAAPDTTPPTVGPTVPGNNTSGNAKNISITATFSEAMSEPTITVSTFTLKPQGGANVSGQVTYDRNNMTATFKPDADLTDNTRYVATITTGVTDLSGNHMAADYSWSFDIGAASDTTPPTVVSTTPADGATGVDTNKATVSITAVFSEDMLASTVTGTTFTLTPASGPSVTGVVTYDGPSKTAKFTPNVNLSPSKKYTATITTGVKDLAGNAMASNKTWAFTTRGAVNVPKTGQKHSWDSDGAYVSNGTPSALGMDGDLQRGMTWPSPRFAANGNAVADNLTGLTWAPDAGTPTVGLCAGGVMNWQAALVYVACLNTSAYLGQTDWRLPNSRELRSLINHGDWGAETGNAAWLNTQGFSNVNAGTGYWTSTSSASNTTLYAWLVFANDGHTSGGNKTSNAYVWPVRDDAKAGTPAALPRTGQTASYAAGDDGDLKKGVSWPSPRFTAGSGLEILCVTDNLTGLMWAKTPPSTPVLDVKTWQDALTYANDLSLCGYDDWRLPNVDELESLVNASQSSQASWLNGQGFTLLQADHYWTSTTYRGTVDTQKHAFTVNMGDGSVHNDVLKTATHYAWPVRGGL